MLYHRHTFLSTPTSHTTNFFSSLNVRGQVSYKYKKKLLSKSGLIALYVRVVITPFNLMFSLLFHSHILIYTLSLNTTNTLNFIT
jgi:hypothetical protein